MVGADASYWVSPYNSTIPVTRYFKFRKIAGHIIEETSENDSSYTQRVDTASTTVLDHFRINVFGYPSYPLNPMRIYAFKVRSFASPEPAWGSWGSEEVCP